ncbi:hypothetical protein AcW1_010364 [Taiwanofungus camphoratus]|nr:hypothetical protein AcW1_010364 [Antrodia cinnamomea]
MHGKEESQFMWSGGRLSPESTQDSADRGKEYVSRPITLFMTIMFDIHATGECFYLGLTTYAFAHDGGSSLPSSSSFSPCSRLSCTVFALCSAGAYTCSLTSGRARVDELVGPQISCPSRYYDSVARADVVLLRHANEMLVDSVRFLHTIVSQVTARSVGNTYLSNLSTNGMCSSPPSHLAVSSCPDYPPELVTLGCHLDDIVNDLEALRRLNV